ncbi:MAG: MetQ/NlpA family ABC transporter substrate-binding protein [Bifidobacterium merycicum]|uniref:MetQ/NlpA family ABC transporter substrate-binding protein n=1 Tax=Bifidobacterium merycicum TaxID=78345 RepID=UPI002E77E094|nr:MetQ/NlpA family ABC transporter substrate-binding protein [Bifidobacterium merycicum]MEE0905088.1 MetQ/NlpA family ABC transporter substrate-binding protein [Bifidobacterium adolescentis]MEE1294358.1 MetQ/NlpA family ABC transporter substrate-binding protein [Bifidobacterium merycicum]
MATAGKAKAKRNLIAALIAVAVVVSGIGGYAIYHNVTSNKGKVVTVGVVGNADDAIWEAVQKQLDAEKSGITIKTKAFQDGIYANQAQANGELDLTAFQHYAFLNQEKKEKGYKLTPIAETYISPLNLYSKKYQSVKDFKSGDKIAIPNNATNTGRALKVLDSAGLIKLKDNTKENPTVDDIAENPSGIDIELNDAAAIINLLPDYAGGITNTNFIIDAGLKASDAVYQAPIDSKNKSFKPYINVIVARDDRKNDPTYKKIVDAYHTKSVADAINKNYKGAVVPVFNY